MRLRPFVYVLGVLSVVAMPFVSSADDGKKKDGDDDPRIARGFDIAPVPLHFKRGDRDLVGLGSYLVNAVGGCVDCHTNPTYLHGGDPFQGQPKRINAAHYLAGGAQFGPFISRNLTPAPNGFAGEHTFEDFLNVIRHGTDLDNPGMLLQVMPWPVYQDMTRHDLHAIFEYLRAIPAAQPCATVGPTAPDPTCRP